MRQQRRDGSRQGTTAAVEPARQARPTPRLPAAAGAEQAVDHDLGFRPVAAFQQHVRAAACQQHLRLQAGVDRAIAQALGFDPVRGDQAGQREQRRQRRHRVFGRQRITLAVGQHRIEHHRDRGLARPHGRNQFRDRCGIGAAADDAELDGVDRETLDQRLAGDTGGIDRVEFLVNAALQPLRQLEAQQIAAARPMIASAKCQRRQSLARLRSLEREAVKWDNAADSRQACELAAQLAIEREPVLPRLLADEPDGDQLVTLLAEHGRIASVSAGGGVFERLAGSSRAASKLDAYLQGHAGEDFATERLAREGRRIERPALTCAVSPQPSLIQGLARSPSFRGRRLLARFLYAVPASWLGRREIAPAPVAEETRVAYGNVVRRLAQLTPGQVLRLDDDAEVIMQLWETELEELLADGAAAETMRDWNAQLAGATLRMAAVLHLAQQAENDAFSSLQDAATISESTLLAAVEIARYLMPHAKSALNLMEGNDDTPESDARYVLRWIERHGRREFTKRDAQQHGRRRFPSAHDIDPALEELVARGYLRLIDSSASSSGRPTSPCYEVNPLVSGQAPRVRVPDPDINRWVPPSSENIESAKCAAPSSATSRPAAATGFENIESARCNSAHQQAMSPAENSIDRVSCENIESAPRNSEPRLMDNRETDHEDRKARRIESDDPGDSSSGGATFSKAG